MLTISIIQESQNIPDDTRGYRYVVRINYKEIARGNIKGHHRKDGWEALVHQIIEDRGECGYKDFHEQNYPQDINITP